MSLTTTRNDQEIDFSEISLGIQVYYKDKEQKLEDLETSHTLGGWGKSGDTTVT